MKIKVHKVGQIIEFIKQKDSELKRALTPDEQRLWDAVVQKTYTKLLPNGLSQKLADEFLMEFRPLFMILLPKNIQLIIKEDIENELEKSQKTLNDYFVRCIGSVLYNQLINFLQRELKLKNN